MPVGQRASARMCMTRIEANEDPPVEYAELAGELGRVFLPVALELSSAWPEVAALPNAVDDDVKPGEDDPAGPLSCTEVAEEPLSVEALPDDQDGQETQTTATIGTDDKAAEPSSTTSDRKSSSSPGQTDGDDAQSTDINQSSSDEETTQTAMPEKPPLPNETEIEAKRIEEGAHSVLEKHGINPDHAWLDSIPKMCGLIITNWMQDNNALTSAKARDQWEDEYPNHPLPGDSAKNRSKNVEDRVKRASEFIDGQKIRKK